MLVRQTQARLWKRTSFHFPLAQGPCGPGRDHAHVLLILRAGTAAIRFRRGPANGGPRGGGEYGHKVSILSRPPSGSLVTFWPSRKSLAPQGETPLRQRKLFYHRPLIRPLRGHLSLSPLSLRDIIPTPFGLRPFPPDRGNRPLDKGSRPPRGKALERLLPRALKETAAPLSKKKRRCHPCA